MKANDATAGHHELQCEDPEGRQPSFPAGKAARARTCKTLNLDMGLAAKQRGGILVAFGLLISGVALLTAVVFLATSPSVGADNGSNPQPGVIINGTTPESGAVSVTGFGVAAMGDSQPLSVLGPV